MELVEQSLPGLMLTFCRMTAMVFSMLVLGRTIESKWPRLLIAAALSLAVFARAPRFVPAPRGLPDLALLAGREVLLGLAIGFSIQIVFATFRIAGDLVGREMGFGLSQVMDPTTGISSPVVGRFLETMIWLLLFAVDAHHRIFRIIVHSFEAVPVGSPWRLEVLKDGLIRLTTESVQLGVRLAGPVYAAILILTITLVVLARAVPQINMMEFAFAVRILVAMAVLTFVIGGLGPLLFTTFDSFLTGVENIVAGLPAR